MTKYISFWVTICLALFCHSVSAQDTLETNRVGLSSPAEITCIHVQNDNEVYVGTNKGKIWYTADGGLNWDSLISNSQQSIFDIVRFEPWGLVIVQGDQNRGNSVFSSRDSGQNWELRGFNCFAQTLAVQDSLIWIGGEGCFGGAIMEVHNSQSLVRRYTDFKQGAMINRIRINNDQGIAVGEDGFFAKFSNSTSSDWSVNFVTDSTASLFDVYFDHPDTLTMVGYDTSESVAYPTVLSSSDDGGITWEILIGPTFSYPRYSSLIGWDSDSIMAIGRNTFRGPNTLPNLSSNFIGIKNSSFFFDLQDSWTWSKSKLVDGEIGQNCAFIVGDSGSVTRLCKAIRTSTNRRHDVMNTLLVSPNPITPGQHLKLNDLERDGYWGITNLHGITVLEGELKAATSSTLIEDCQLAPGVYCLTYKIHDGPSMVAKIIVTR